MAKGKALQAVVEIAGSISPTLGKSIEEATGKLSGINVKALAVGAAVGGIAVATGKAVIEASKYLVDLGSQFDAATDSIRIGTGATGDALDSLMEDFDAVYSSVPTTMEDASKAIADYNTRLGLTGPALQNISTQAIQVADMLGEDLGGVIKESSQAFQAWNIDAKDMGEAMDYVFKASQSTGVGFSDLMSSVQQFAPQLQELGYSFEESVALIGQMDKAGVNASEVLSAMKKSVSSLAKEGLSASEGMELYAEKIKNAKDMTEATTIASEIFGTKAASTMAAAIRDGTISVADLTAELEGSSETINGCAGDTYDFAEKLQLFKQQAQVALEPLASTLFDSLNELMPIAADAMTQLMPILGQLSQAIIPIVQDLAPQIAPLLTQLIPPIVSMAGVLAGSVIPPIVEIATRLIPAAISIVSALMPITQVLIETALPILVDIIRQIIPPVVQIVTDLLPVIQQLLTATAPIVTQLFTALSPVLAAAGQLISTLLPPVISLTQKLMPIITTVASIISTTLKVAIQGLMPVIEGAISVVGTISSVFEAAFSGLVGIVKTPINAIIVLVNKAIRAINSISIDVPDWVPGLGGKHFGFSIPTIPMLKTGGFTEGISIAGEAGTEAVISFDPAYREANIGYWLEAGRRLGINDGETETSQAGKLLTLDDFSLSEMSAGQTIIYYDFSGFTWSPTFGGVSEDENEDLMAELKDHEAEFFDWLEEWLKVREEGRYCTA